MSGGYNPNPEVSGSGTISALNGAVTLNIPSFATVAVNITGTWTATLAFEGSTDGTTFFSIRGIATSTGVTATSITANSAYVIPVGGYQSFRVRASAYSSGTATVTYNADSTPTVQSSRQLVGGTDSTLIGNISDRLKVDASFSTPQTVVPAYTGTTIRFDDMNASTGGVARDTGIASTSVYTTLYSYTGSGQLFSFLVGLEGNLIGADDFNIKLEIDGTTVWTISTADVGTGNLYNLNTVQDEVAMGMSLTSNVFRFASPTSGGLSYASSVKVYVKKASSATSKRFRAGAVYLTKVT